MAEEQQEEPFGDNDEAIVEEDIFVPRYEGEARKIDREVVSLTGVESKDSLEDRKAKTKHEKYVNYLISLREIDMKRTQVKSILDEINRHTRQMNEETDTETDTETESEGETESESESDAESIHPVITEDGAMLLSKERTEGTPTKKQKKKKRKVDKRNMERKIHALRNLYEEENLELIIMVANAMRLQKDDPEQEWKDLEVDPDDQANTEENMYKQLAEAVCGSIADKGMDTLTGPCFKVPVPCREEEFESSQKLKSSGKQQKKSRKKRGCRDKIMKNMLEKLRKMQGYLKTVSLRRGSDNTVSILQSSIDALKKKIIIMCEGHGGPVLQPQSELETYEIQKMQNEIKDMKAEIYEKEAERKILKSLEPGQTSPVEVEPIPPVRYESTKQDKMRALLKEQSEELDFYSKKYKKVKEKVTKQTLIIERIDENNRFFQQQINLQIDEIKSKFENKLTDLLRYPAKLDITRIKLNAVKEEREEIERQLRSYCKLVEEMKKLQEKESRKKRPNCALAMKKCMELFWQLQKGHKFCAVEKEKQYNKLIQMKAQMQTVKNETASAICGIGEASDAYKSKKMEQIQNLECQLQKCRASACLAVGDREDEIKELECKIEETSCKFDKAQEQIRKLKAVFEDLTKQNSKRDKGDCKF